MKIDINGISITLTQDQLDEITRQTNKLTVKNIDYLSAKTLLDNNRINPDPNRIFMGDLLRLVTIIKAVNFIDNNNQEWIPNFTDNNYKYLPYLKKNSSGWSVCGVGDCGWNVDGLVGLYFKSKESAELISNKYIGLYSKIQG